MQTFLPSSVYPACASMLDNRRLGKQRVEARDILYVAARLRGLRLEKQLCLSERAAEYLFGRYRNHPAVLMWVGYERSLAQYASQCCVEWKRRGYRDSLLEPIEAVIDELPWPFAEVPAWLGDERLHASHRSSLLKKHPEHYRENGWFEPAGMEYFWPTRAPEYRRTFNLIRGGKS